MALPNDSTPKSTDPKPTDPVAQVSPGSQARAAANQAASGVSDADKRAAEKALADKRAESAREGDKRADANRANAEKDGAKTEQQDILEEIAHPISDRNATGSATPIPPAVLGGPEPVPDDAIVSGMTIPSLNALSGEEQNRFEVMTGKRLQQRESAVVDARKVREDAERKAGHAPASR